MTLWRRILCWLGDHQWTCAAEQGIKPTAWQLKSAYIGFNDYATMYCKACGHRYTP